MTAGYLDTRVYALYSKIPAASAVQRRRRQGGVNELRGTPR